MSLWSYKKAKVARFYGWTDDVIQSMDFYDFEEYFMAAEVISKEETVDGLTVSMFPHLLENRRTQVFNELKKFITSRIDRGAPVIKGYGEVVSNLKRKLGRG